MLWVVLEVVPSASSVADVILSVADVIPIEVVVVIDVDVAAAIPIAITPPVIGDACAENQTRPERETHSGIVTGISVGVVWIGGRAVDYRGVVRRDVNHAGIGLLNYDHLFVPGGLRCHLLFLGRFQISFRLGFPAHPLDRIHHIRLLRQKGVSQLGCPLNVTGQSRDDIWDRYHRLDGRIPWLLQHCIGKSLAL
jgi:hypothetical protein